MDTIDKVPEAQLMKKGAEASLFITQWHGRKAVIKVRIPKVYRPNELDQSIRYYRTVHEAQLIYEAKAAGVKTPLIYIVKVSESTIVMEHIKGERVKDLLSKSNKTKNHQICLQIGESIGQLHKNGLIHGDLTTSNMIQTKDNRICFIDFGLGEKSVELEAQGVDLHLLKRALQSTHFEVWEECFKNVLRGYASIRGIGLAEKVYEKIREIERRGRYVEERKQHR
jgi:TP53 regulating kinase and related kinases